MATNTNNGWRRGQQKDRYQLYNEVADRYDKYDGNGNHLAQKSSPGPWKGVEERTPRKPPRG